MLCCSCLHCKRKVTIWRFQNLKKFKKEITYWTGSGVSGSDLQKVNHFVCEFFFLKFSGAILDKIENLEFQVKKKGKVEHAVRALSGTSSTYSTLLGFLLVSVVLGVNWSYFLGVGFY